MMLRKGSDCESAVVQRWDQAGQRHNGLVAWIPSRAVTPVVKEHNRARADPGENCIDNQVRAGARPVSRID